MRRIAMAVGVAVALAGVGTARAQDCYRKTAQSCVEKGPHALPKSPQEFLELRKQIGSDPYGGAILLAHALLVREQDKALGEQLLVLAVSEDHVAKADGGGTYGGWSLAGGKVTQWLVYADRAPHCIRSYAAGSSPDNGYEYDRSKVALRFRKQDAWVGTVESGTYKVFLCSTGTDSCRPITMTRNDAGIWKAKEWNSLVVGCRPAAEKNGAASRAAQEL